MQLLSDGRANVISFQGHPYFEATVRKSISEWRFVCADCFEKSTPEFDFVVKFDLSLDLCDFKGWINRLKTPQQVDVLASVCVDVLQSRASAVNHLN
jgi:hypothetical protein